VIPDRSAAALDLDFIWANPKPQGNALHALAFENDQIGYAVGGVGAGLKTVDGGQTWTVQTRYPEFQKQLRDVIVLGPGQLLAAGEPPGLYRSSDGGASWTPVSNPSTATLQHLAKIPNSDLVISAIGGNGQIVRSTDGGVTWTLQASPGPDLLRDQFWWDAAHGFVVGDLLARRTTDGGLTWQPLPGVPGSPFTLIFTDITFHDAANGWLFEHFTTFRTTNGGASWFESHGTPGQAPIYQEEALVLSPSHRFVITLLEGAQIWETVNDGTSWSLRYERNRTQGYTDIERLPNGALVVTSTFGDLLRSTNSGQTWLNFVTCPDDGERTSMNVIGFLPGGKAFAGGWNSVWLESLDGGDHWQIPATTPGFLTPNAIVFRGDLLGLVGGYGPVGQTKVARTNDGGTTWSLHSLAASYAGYIQEIAFPDDAIAYAVTSGGNGVNHVFRSTDGGVSWGLRSQGVSTSIRLETIFFLDVNTGFVGGGEFSDAAIWKTTDAGGVWTPLPETGLLQEPIQDMVWWDAATGLVAGFDGASRTTNGGQTWAPVLHAPVLALDFRDALRGFATSYFGELIWVTEDGGVTWDSMTTPWEGEPVDIKAVGGGFVLCGNGTVILAAREPGASGIPEGDSPAVARGLELRVWPNPSHGVAGRPLTFGINRQVLGPVEVRLYDAAGRLVETMTRRADGEAAWAWDPGLGGRGPLAAGTYFVEARVGTGERARGRFVVVP
jgi:photosystem II stability/assembly factor-like uncharacterized protein